MDDYTKDEDFLIRVRPFHKNNEWTGEVDISIVASSDNPLDDDSLDELMHFCTMVCSTVPLMETDEALRNRVHDYVMDCYESTTGDIAIKLDEKEVDITHEGDNIVRLNFGTSTKGSA